MNYEHETTWWDALLVKRTRVSSRARRLSHTELYRGNDSRLAIIASSLRCSQTLRGVCSVDISHLRPGYIELRIIRKYWIWVQRDIMVHVNHIASIEQGVNNVAKLPRMSVPVGGNGLKVRALPTR